MEDSETLVGFYERSYSVGGERGNLYAQWRALGAVGKADHVLALCRRAGLEPASTLDVGCGDGALLRELAARGLGGRLGGAEISAPAAAIAREAGVAETIELFDGAALPFGDGSYELGILSHVLEHVPDPPALLAETARVCAAVVVEVPLEANWSARRRSKRAHSEEIGHLQRLDRSAARTIVAAAGLRVGAELQDPLPLTVHRFFATTPFARAAAGAKWGVRSGLNALTPALARRVFTVHWACLAVRPGA